MPSKSVAQKRTMTAASKSRTFAAKAGIPQGVAKEFHRADVARGPVALPAKKLTQK